MKPLKIYELFKNLSFSYSTDTREDQEGKLFFALKGWNFNGNLYADEAIEKGAEFAIVDEIHNFKYPAQIIKTIDVKWTFGQLANLYRNELDIEIIAIAGSNGKTTTKELLAAALGKKYEVHSTAENFNNEIGVPKTLLSIKPTTEIAIIEMGAAKKGDIKYLCKIAEPNVGVLTNIGKEHLEGFGGMEGVIQGEKELFDYLDATEGTAFVNIDDENIAIISDEVEKIITYGVSDTAKIKGTLISAMPNIKGSIEFYDDEKIEIDAKLGGDFNFSNMLAAATIADYFEVDQVDIKDALEHFESNNNRSQNIKTERNLVVSDAYNANPSSMEVSIKNFATMEGENVVMLGEMAELGIYSEVEHLTVLNLLKGLSINKAFLVGGEFSKYKNEFPDYKFFSETDALKESLIKDRINNSNVLLKGSRVMKMESLIECL